MDINIYRARIGLFCPKLRRKKFLLKSEIYNEYCSSKNKSQTNVFIAFQTIFKLVLLLGFLHPVVSDSSSCCREVIMVNEVVHLGAVGLLG